MFDKVLLVLRKLIGQIEYLSNDSDSKEGSSEEPFMDTKPVSKIKPKNKLIVKNTPTTTSVVKKVINKEALAKKIKRNMFFLDELVMKLEDKPTYVLYYEKVVELKTQSEATYKILHRLTLEKPYYQKTLEMILRHTNIVAELLED